MKLEEYKKNKKLVGQVVECLSEYSHFKRTQFSECRKDCGVFKMCNKIYLQVKKGHARGWAMLLLDDAIVAFGPIDKMDVKPKI
ncbi:MAG: hypothetical protein WC976_06725 [Caldisericia bacterium]